MYDDFNEEKIMSVMEGSMKEKAGKAADYIKQKWQQIKQWFASTFKAIANHFTSGEKLVQKHKNAIPKAIAESTAKVKIPVLKDMDEANGKCRDIVGGLKASRISGDKGKEEVLKIVGVEDKKGIGNKVKGFFFGEVAEIPVKNFANRTGMLMKWAGGKKEIIDSFKKQQKQVDDDFKEILGKLKEDAKKDGAGDKEQEIVKNFNFALGLKNTVLSSQLACNKQACNIATQIIRKALGGGHEDAMEKKINQKALPGAVNDKEAVKKYNQQRVDQENEVSNKGVGPALASWLPQFEAVEFIEDETDDWNWE